MPPYEVKVEVIPHIGEKEPSSVNKLRELKASGVSGSENVSSLQVHQLISFVIDCASEDEALDQAQGMCDKLLVNPVLASGEISVTEM